MKSIYVVLVFLLVSCSSENANELENKINYGDYTAQIMTSNVAFDANLDGNYSNDFLAEFIALGGSYQSRLKIANIGDNTSFVNITLPTMYKFAPTVQDETITILNRTVSANINNKSFMLTAFSMLDNDGNPTNTKIIDFTIVDSNTIKIKVNHSLIYDVPTTSWKTIVIDALYKKN